MAIMFDYRVKYNGKYYPADTPIEEAPEKPAEAADGGESTEEKESVKDEAEAPKKPAKGRKKGDA